jgi:type III pantothenate kinase
LNLAIDIGNSSVKAALFDEGHIVEKFIIHNSKFIIPAGVDKAIVVSTRGGETEIERVVRERVGTFVKFDHTTPVPVKNLYATPETLGCDRLAAAVGAHAMFPGRTALVCDFGTAITYDVVTAAGEFLGGNISPGAASRFRALHDYTGTLPLCSLPDLPSRRSSATARKANGEPVNSLWLFPLPARDTKSAIETGVVAGIVAETEAYIETAKKNFSEIKIIFTGGDADYFAERVKYTIFATSDLVLYGLVRAAQEADCMGYEPHGHIF